MIFKDVTVGLLIPIWLKQFYSSFGVFLFIFVYIFFETETVNLKTPFLE